MRTQGQTSSECQGGDGIILILHVANVLWMTMLIWKEMEEIEMEERDREREERWKRWTSRERAIEIDR